jgi:hypothetical protein
MSKHPVEAVIERMSWRDQEIAEQLREAGFTDESLYAVLPTPGAVKLLENKPVKEPK